MMDRQEEFNVRWIIMSQQGPFTEKNAIEAVNERLRQDYSNECLKILDRLLKTRLIEPAGQNEIGEYLYKAIFQ